jgi:hypothetical protein
MRDRPRPCVYGKAKLLRCELRWDSLAERVLHIRTQELQPVPHATKATLTATRRNGGVISGADSVRIVLGSAKAEAN